ncbi:hypothetical protein [Ideonella alba]|uniref:Uncharacterized protein n=1 Tax=Ideonella alba TaxID=2824118 RepID=A0A940YGN7_9BURK|nr:hypothetical protein [Ideonella alba]MBQ0932165.1 hypothetical protein [Ideonella alba]
MNTRFLATSLFTLAALASSAVEAKILANAVRATNFSFTTATALVPLNAAGDTTITVQNNKARTVNAVLTFSAECAALAPTAGGWLDLDVLVNDVAIAPTAGNTDAFCPYQVGTTINSWVRPSITMVVPLQPGANTVKIQARLDFGVTTGWVSDTALVITD